MLSLNKHANHPIYLQLYTQLKNDIINGLLNTGAKLHSSRILANELNVSRNTVDLAYQQLLAEGFIKSRPRAGYFVDNLYKTTNQPEDSEACFKKKKKAQITAGFYDFACEAVDPKDIPCREWKKLTNLCFSDYAQELAKPKDIFGELELRLAIKNFLYHYRHINCDASQILLTGDLSFSLDLLCRIFGTKTDGLNIILEDPCDDKASAIFSRYNRSSSYIPLDGHGATVPNDTDNFEAYYLTTYSQFPTGIITPLTRLKELANHAQQKNYYLIENDYDSCFQYSPNPAPALKALAPENVIYLGSFSEFLCPCINISFIIFPSELQSIVTQHLHTQGPLIPYLIQKPLELMMKDGYFEKHLRKINKRRTQKKELLINELKKKFAHNIKISAQDSETYLLISPNWSTTEDELITSAYNYGVQLYSTNQYWHNNTSNSVQLLLGYRSLPLESISTAIALLYAAWSPYFKVDTNRNL